jgi:DNA polymerase III epsilon subunit family exonuclease
MPKLSSSEQLGLGLSFTKKIDIDWKNPTLICLDIEATGFQQDKDDIIEVAAVKFNLDGEIDRFSTLIHTDLEIPFVVSELTNINNEMLVNAPQLATIKTEFLDFIGDYPIVGHNINFDINFLVAKGFPIEQNLRIDTFPLSQILIKQAASYSLETLSHHLTNHQPTHRALDDVLANIELLFELLKIWQKRKTELTETILENSKLDFKELLLNSQITGEPKSIPTNNKTQQKQITALGNRLIVLSEELIDNYQEIQEDTTIITPHYRVIDEDKFLNYSKELELEEETAITLVKIAINLDKNNKVDINNINLHASENNIAQNLTLEKPLNYETNQQPKLISHSYFFQLLKSFPEHQLLKIPITFYDHPFLEETYTRANTNIIHHSKITQTEDLELINCLNQIWLSNKNIDDESPLIIAESITGFGQIGKILNLLQQNNLAKPDLNSDLIWLTKSNKEKPPTIQWIKLDLNYNIQDIALKHSLNLEIVDYTNSASAVIEAHDTLPNPNDMSFNTKAQAIIDQLIYSSSKDPETAGDICIIATSHDQIKSLYKNCVQNHPDHDILAQKITGSAGKIMHRLLEREDRNILICTYQFYLMHKPQFRKLSHLILTKLPISTPNHPFYTLKKQTDNNFFMNFVIPHTIQNLLQTIEIGQAAERISLLDSRLKKTNYGETIEAELSKYIDFEVAKS